MNVQVNGEQVELRVGDILFKVVGILPRRTMLIRGEITRMYPHNDAFEVRLEGAPRIIVGAFRLSGSDRWSLTPEDAVEAYRAHIREQMVEYRTRLSDLRGQEIALGDILRDLQESRESDECGAESGLSG